MKAAQHGGDDEKAINAAIHIVSTSKDEHLASQLIGFLNGEQDNIPKVNPFGMTFLTTGLNVNIHILKDGKYLFRLYLARNQYKEATKTALIIATEEQNAGKH